jgi:hypothetical protein
MSGTYVPKNDAAKNSYYGKFVFGERTEKIENDAISFNGRDVSASVSGSTVKIYPGMMGMSIGVAHELRYKLEGNKLILEAGIPGISGAGFEFIYDKEKDEIILDVSEIAGVTDRSLLPTWGKEGSFDPKNPFPDKTALPIQEPNKTETKIDSANTNNQSPAIENNTGNSSSSNDGNTQPINNSAQIAFDQTLAALYSAMAYQETRIKCDDLETYYYDFGKLERGKPVPTRRAQRFWGLRGALGKPDKSWRLVRFFWRRYKP